MPANHLEPVTWVSDHTEPNPEIVRLANGAPFPRRITARTAIGDGPTITFSVAVQDGVPVMTHFAADQRSGGSAVTATLIHDLPVRELFDQLISYLGWGADLMQSGYDNSNAVHLMPTDAERQAAGARAISSQRGRPVSDESLRKVAEIVNAEIAKGNNYDRRNQVREELHLSKRTASRYIAEARKRGLIEEGPDQ